MEAGTKIKLKNFREMTGDAQRECINTLINEGRGPLRVHKKEVKGQEIAYLRVRTWPQYLWENLLFFTKNKAKAEREALAAIYLHIHPHLRSLRDKVGRNNNRHAVELIDKLGYRVFNNHVGTSYFQAKKPCESIEISEICKEPYVATARIGFGNKLTVPKGISLSRISPDMVHADVHIRCSKKRNQNKDTPSTSGKDRKCPPGTEARTDNNLSSHATIYKLTNIYLESLNRHAIGKKTVVLQLDGNDQLHWLVAHTVAKKFIEDTRTEDGSTSIMLIPPSLDDGFGSPSRLSSEEWLNQRINDLKFLKVRGENSSCSSADRQKAYGSFGHISDDDQ